MGTKLRTKIVTITSSDMTSGSIQRTQIITRRDSQEFRRGICEGVESGLETGGRRRRRGRHEDDTWAQFSPG